MMKKMVSLCALLLFACSLFGCGSAESAAETPAGSGSSTASEESGALALVTDPYGGLFRNGAATETGYYEIISTQPEYINVLYTDYQTLTRTYLCSSPECLHYNALALLGCRRWGKPIFLPAKHKIKFIWFPAALPPTALLPTQRQ